jgi:hypothetical protein
MNNNDKLFELIKSLSQTEKGYIKKSVLTKKGEEIAYIKMFDALCAINEYDEKKFLEKNKKEAFTKNFSKNKNQLYNTVLKRLVRYHEEHHPQIKTKELLNQATILAQKGLPKQAVEQYEKALEMAKEHEDYASAYQACIGITQIHGSAKIGFELPHEGEMEKIIPNLDKTYRLYTLHNQMSKYLFSDMLNEESKEGILALINHPFLNSITSNDGLRLQLQKINHISHGYHLLRDIKKTNELKLEYYNLIKSDKNFQNNNVRLYLIGIHNLVNSRMNACDYSDIPALLEEVKAVQTKSEAPDDELLKMNGFYINSLGFNIVTKNFLNAKKLLEEVIPWLEKNENNLTDYWKTEYYNNIFLIYFSLAEFKSCIPWINKIKDNKSQFRVDQQLSCKIKLLILHYELKNYSLIEYFTRSVYREFINQGSDLEAEKYIIRNFQKILKNIDKNSYLKENAKEIRNKIKALNENYKNSLKNSTPFIDYWLESKIQNKPIAELKEKITAEIS